jgi:hypothetical protein
MEGVMRSTRTTGAILVAIGLALSACAEGGNYPGDYGASGYDYGTPAYSSFDVGWGGWHRGWGHGHGDGHPEVHEVHGDGARGFEHFSVGEGRR